MFRAILLQLLATAIAASIAGVYAGTHGLVSAVLGGAVCILPNFLFAVHLSMAAKRSGAPSSAGFFLGEFVKLAAIIGLLLLVAGEYTDLHWPSMLIGLVSATQVLFFAFWKKKN